jgi:hypothetical protein
MLDRAGQKRRTLIDSLAGVWVIAATVDGDGEDGNRSASAGDTQFGIGDQDATKVISGSPTMIDSGPRSRLAMAAAAGEPAQ